MLVFDVSIRNAVFELFVALASWCLVLVMTRLCCIFNICGSINILPVARVLFVFLSMIQLALSRSLMFLLFFMLCASGMLIQRIGSRYKPSILRCSTVGMMALLMVSTSVMCSFVCGEGGCGLIRVEN